MSDQTCQQCDSVLDDPSAKFCPNCGSLISAVQHVDQRLSSIEEGDVVTPQEVEIEARRPIGLTIISVLYVVGGLTILYSGIPIVLFGLRTATLSIAGPGAGLLVFGALVIYKAYGLWQGYRWARTVLFLFMVLGIAYCIVVFLESYLILYFIPMLLNVLVIYYARGESVKRYFGIQSG